MKRLPLLGQRGLELSTCGYCPRLCRSACPVSNADPRETWTPWGKMTTSWLATRALAPVDRAHAKTAWACTGCLRCQEQCDHRNPVAEVLTEARADYVQAGVEPPSTRWIARAADARDLRRRALAKSLNTDADASKIALLAGCAYTSRSPELVRQQLELTRQLMGQNVELLSGCCGAPEVYAGQLAAHQNQRARLLDEIQGRRLIVSDPGCAVMLRDLAPTTLIELAHENIERFRATSSFAASKFRYHDACQLGRGLGLYEQPRQLLARVVGRAPEEFTYRRELAACSGGGGVLPVSMPRTSATTADQRIAEHQRLGGGVIVTGCAMSLWRFRSRGAEAIDISGLLYQGFVRG